jgi:hypothetical protein
MTSTSLFLSSKLKKKTQEWNAGIGGTCWEGGVLLARFLR